MASAYGLTNNNTGDDVVVNVEIDWDNGDFLSLYVVTDDDDQRELISIVSGTDTPEVVDAFFLAVEEAKVRWEKKKAES